jgi:hypothetical protein
MSQQLASSFFKGVLNLKSPCVSLLIFFCLQKLRDTYGGKERIYTEDIQFTKTVHNVLQRGNDSA